MTTSSLILITGSPRLTEFSVNWGVCNPNIVWNQTNKQSTLFIHSESDLYTPIQFIKSLNQCIIWSSTKLQGLVPRNYFRFGKLLIWILNEIAKHLLKLRSALLAFDGSNHLHWVISVMIWCCIQSTVIKFDLPSL